MDYQRMQIKSTVAIHKMITMYYFEFGKHYSFLGESHNFWEFLYVDKGDLEVWADDRSYLVNQGTIIFHKPNEFHQFYAKNDKAPNVIVMTFDCRSKAMKRFENAVIRLGEEERNLLARIVEEGASAFGFPFHYPLVRRENARIGSEQLVKLYLELLLIHLLRRDNWAAETKPLSLPSREKGDGHLARKAFQLLQEKIDSNVSLDELSDSLHVSKTRLKDVFKLKTGHTVKEYFSNLKIERAKVLIREESCNFTEIAAILGFSSIHVFSRSFKRVTDMTPSEYAKSVQGRLKT